MEKYQALIKEAHRNFQLADYMINVTYPKISDPKMLLSAMDSLFLAADYSLSSILYHERFLKRLPPFHDSFENKFHLFKENCVRRYKVDAATLKLVQEIKETVFLHKSSPVEFRRKDSYVICSDKYDVKTITHSQIREQLKHVRSFLELAGLIVQDR